MERDRSSTFFPLFMDLSQLTVLVIGAGHIATRRVKAMEPFAPQLVVVAPEASDEIRALVDAERIEWRNVPYQEALIKDADVVLACTDNHELNEKIHDDCKRQGILVNVCSNRELCDFYFPGIVRTRNTTIGINASGRDHARAKDLRERIELMLEDAND